MTSSMGCSPCSTFCSITMSRWARSRSMMCGRVSGTRSFSCSRHFARGRRSAVLPRGPSCYHRRLRVREITTLLPRCLCHYFGATGGRLAHRLSSIRGRTPSSHGRLSGWRFYSRKRIRTSLRVISVARDKISSSSINRSTKSSSSVNTWKTRRTEICAVINNNWFLCAPVCSPTASPYHPHTQRVRPLCFIFAISHFIFEQVEG